MSKEILQDIIEDFEPDKFLYFFREKNRNFKPRRKELKEYDDEFFIGGEKIGEIEFDTANMLFACFKCKDDLTERSSKKRQYEKARKVLKGLSYDSGIFIFYDKSGNFRFSLIYTNYAGKRDWSNYKRFTYYVSKERTNKTFKSRIGESKFDNYEAIKEAFSVDKVTKEFYTDIANWYFWAVDNVEFPEQAEEITDGRKIAVLRLITRLIFIWFMRELKLIPKELFMQENIETDLKDTSEDESTYYKAILQNLFFATLSTPKEQRQFTAEARGIKGHNKDFGNHSVFRYQELFKKPEELKSLFGDIPYLNGGLFECLDNKEERIYIDGFSRTKKNQPTVPNYLFFAKEHKEDLNNWYGTDGKNYNVRGLLDILSSYNFTTDENSSDDSDVALDPELLGKVFENLLASFNPETSTTARKATGSFYTPREIVDYMVTESLKEYFKTHLTQIEDLDVKLESLFNKSATDNPFSSKESRILVQLIENVRIVDPAVGSGAFPMGILNKLVFILNKVDSGNKLWKEAQLKSVESMPDSTLREQTKKHIEKYFTEKNHDYGRKLYLIQKCIYGVDIQQIAVEIAKLRFFIALLVDEKIDKKDGDNWGIEPLPNLDFKIMQGNSLLEEYAGIKLFDEKLFIEDNNSGKSHLELLKETRKQIEKEYMELHRNKKLTKFKKAELDEKLNNLAKKIKSYSGKESSGEFENDIFDTLKKSIENRDELKKLHQEFFETNSKEIKDKLRKQIDILEWELIKETLISQNKKSQLPELEKIRKTNSKPFFLWKLHFAEVFEQGGFDIVIGNPPYVSLQKLPQEYKTALINQNYSTWEAMGDLYILFYEKGYDLLAKSNSVLSFITSNTWLQSISFRKARIFLSNKFHWNESIIFLDKIFNAVVDANIMLMRKKNNTNEKATGEIRICKYSNEKIQFYSYFPFDKIPKNGDAINFSLKLGDYELYESIVKRSNPLSDYFLVYNGVKPFEKGKGNPPQTQKTMDNKPFVKIGKKPSVEWKPLLRGSLINKFHNKWNYDYWILYGKWLAAPRSKDIFEAPEKLVVRQTGDSIVSAYVDNKFIARDNLHLILPNNNQFDLKCCMAIINSKLMDFVYQVINPEKGEALAQIKKGHVEMLPLIKLSDMESKVCNNLVEIIINLKKKFMLELSNYFESLIDAMVYELYFPESIKAANAEVIELVKKQIPDISNIEDKDKKLEMIEKAYKKLSDPENEINKRIERQNTLVEEVKIINESLSKQPLTKSTEDL